MTKYPEISIHPAYGGGTGDYNTPGAYLGWDALGTGRYGMVPELTSLIGRIITAAINEDSEEKEYYFDPEMKIAGVHFEMVKDPETMFQARWQKISMFRREAL